MSGYSTQQRALMAVGAGATLTATAGWFVPPAMACFGAPEGLLPLAAGAVLTAIALLWQLRAQRRTLAKLIHQLEEAANGHYAGQVQPPQQELVPLARAINVTLERVASRLQSHEHSIEVLQEEVAHDALTGLASRSFFTQALQGCLTPSEDATIGPPDQPLGLVLLRINDMIGLNQRIGRHQVDELIRSVGALLRARAPRWRGGEAVVSRLSGADFGILLPEASRSALDAWVEALCDAAARLHRDRLSDRDPVYWVGSTLCHGHEAPGDVLSRADAALQKCEREGRIHYHAAASMANLNLPVARWRTLIDEALEAGRLGVALRHLCVRGTEVLFQRAEGQLRMPEGGALAEDAFYPPALRAARTLDIDLRVIELALLALRGQGHDLCVRISLQSLARPTCLSALQALMAARREASGHLWLEVEVSGETGDQAEVARLRERLQAFGVHIGVVDPGMKLEALCAWLSSGIRFLRLDPDCCSRLQGQAGKSRLQALTLLARLAASAGTLLIAPSVPDPADQKALLQCGIDCLLFEPSVTPPDPDGAAAAASRSAEAAA